MGKAAGALAAVALLGGGTMTVLSTVMGGYAEFAALGVTGLGMVVAGQLFGRGVASGEPAMGDKQPANG